MTSTNLLRTSYNGWKMVVFIKKISGNGQTINHYQKTCYQTDML